MALAMVTDTTEMYKNVKQEIGKIGVDGSEHDQSLRKKEQRIAMEAT